MGYSDATFTFLGIKDVNNNKPVFRDCAGYSEKAKVPEGKHKNYTIIKVRLMRSWVAQ